MSTTTLERRYDLADSVLQAAVGVPPDVLGIVATALRLDGGGLAEVGGALDSFAVGSGDLARMQMARALDRLARFGDPELIVRLDAAEAEPWQALAAAVAVLRDDDQ